MIEVKGKYNEAKIFADIVDDSAIGQVVELCNQEFTKGSKIRIMPDTHAGAGCTIGTTMTITDKIVPNLVGVDIGCGMSVCYINIDESEVDYAKLDEVIRKHIPHGFKVRDNEHRLSNYINYKDIIAPINEHRARLSIGTLGGGNHFIELNRVKDGQIMIVIHSGSRNLGKQIAEHYQDLAYDRLMNIKNEQQEIIDRLKSEGRDREIHEALQRIKKPKIKKDLAWLEGEDFKNYMNDMKIAQKYASRNRTAMAEVIIKNMGWERLFLGEFTTIHNYIDMDNMILRKGAISAQEGEVVIVPINMRDGSIIARGKGNPDWNFSGPHGAGRLMSRKKAKENINIEQFEYSMANVWSSSVNESTLDEAPMAYKPIESILDNIDDTLVVDKIVKPIYNFKSN